MAKYVCDFDEVNKIADELKNIANNMNTDITEFETELNQALSGWKGKSSDTFATENSEYVNLIKKQIEYLNEASDFLKNAVQNIEETEENLAALSI